MIQFEATRTKANVLQGDFDDLEDYFELDQWLEVRSSHH